MDGLKEGNESWNERDIEELLSGVGGSVRSASGEMRFLALWACIQMTIVTSITDTRFDTTVIPDWLNSRERHGSGTKDMF